MWVAGPYNTFTLKKQGWWVRVKDKSFVNALQIFPQMEEPLQHQHPPPPWYTWEPMKRTTFTCASYFCIYYIYFNGYQCQGGDFCCVGILNILIFLILIYGHSFIFNNDKNLNPINNIHFCVSRRWARPENYAQNSTRNGAIIVRKHEPI